MKNHSDHEVPTLIRELIESWRAAGSPTQPGIDWQKNKWITAFPEMAHQLEGLPLQLSRQDVVTRVRDSRFDTDDTRLAFILVMAWGYGEVGYGVWRVNRILIETPNAPARLLKVREILSRSDAITGYKSLCGECKIPWLGPAFGTKLLYFFGSSNSSKPPLILDEMVASWLNRNLGLSIKPWGWSTTTYREYLKRMYQWADTLSVSPVDIETCIFRAEANTRPDNQWGR
jgi:hypothetical protein